MTDVSNPGTSRREVIGNAALGLAIASAAPAFAQDKHAPGAPTSAGSASYPKPPLARQSQPRPGLTLQMSPRPDRDETSYLGSWRLAGRLALITVGDSGMGRAAAMGCLLPEQSDADEVAALIRQAGRRQRRWPLLAGGLTSTTGFRK